MDAFFSPSEFYFDTNVRQLREAFEVKLETISKGKSNSEFDERETDCVPAKDPLLRFSSPQKSPPVLFIKKPFLWVRRIKSPAELGRRY